MRGPLRLRALSEEEERVIRKLAHSRTASARLVQRAKIIELAKEGRTIPQIMQQLHLSEHMVRKWWKRFEQQGPAGLEDAPRPGAPSRYTPENKARVLQAALTRPTDLNLGFSSWTFERLAAYVREHLGIQISRSAAYRLLQKVRSQGEAGLQDGRHGHPAKLREPVQQWLKDYCHAAPGTPSHTVQQALANRFGIRVSISHLNATRAALGLGSRATPFREKNRRRTQAPNHSG